MSAPASVDVIVADLAGAPPGIDRVLDERERAAAQRMPAGRPRGRRAAARAILRMLLAARLGGVEPSQLRIEAGAHGKPRLRGSEIRFNVSHSEDLALFAIADGVEVGVDVEVTAHRHGRSRDELAIARRLLDAETCSRLAALAGRERSAAFLEAWVAHEARVKCAGTGLGVASEQRAASVAEASDPGIWVTALQVGAGVFAALAVEGGPVVVRLRRWQPQDLPASSRRSPRPGGPPARFA